MKEYIFEAPSFGGFYGCELLNDLDDLTGFAYDNPELYNKLVDNKLDCDFYNKIRELVDWQKTEEEICKWLVSSIYWNTFCKYAENMVFDHLWKPQYYNFSTDKIYMKVTLSEDQLNNIELYCFEEKKSAFEGYLKENFSTRSGFISFIPNNLQEFQEEYGEFKRQEADAYDKYLGILFEFIFIQKDREGYVFPYDCECIHECLTYLSDFDEEKIANELLEGCKNNF
jgi:hypothetical protein